MASYNELARRNKLKERVRLLYERFSPCHLCPHECMIDRESDNDGICGAGSSLVVSSAFPHFGEEPPITGHAGSGTIFFAYCNLRCQFCQNYDISHYHRGEVVYPHELARIMLSLQAQGCHNINLVTPTHFLPQIMEALLIAVDEGLNIPIVYNCGGYESVETLELLEGIVDIYMPDWKFFNSESASRYTSADDYPEKALIAIKEMYRQVGDLEMDELGVARKGLLIRHLVLPEHLDETEDILENISREISVRTYVNVMDQYRPTFEAYRFPEINRRITASEYSRAITKARELGLTRGLEYFM